MNTATNELKNYVNTTEFRGKHAFIIHHTATTLSNSAPLISWYIYNSREEATAAAVKILVALMPPEKPQWQ